MGTTLLRDATIVTMNEKDEILTGDVMFKDDRSFPSGKDHG